MEIIFCVAIAVYSVFLNLRLRDIEERLEEYNMENTDLELRMYNKMMDIRKDLKESINEKSRRKSAKKRRRVSKNAVSTSKILRKFRGDKNNIQAGGKG
tara:strand:+ start:1092 stop:1388 length:297 start_codon:yes stop_codon:yes gene_type:complete